MKFKQIIGWIQIVFGVIMGLISHFGYYWIENPDVYGYTGDVLTLTSTLSWLLIFVKWFIVGASVIIVLQGIVNIKDKKN